VRFALRAVTGMGTTDSESTYGAWCTKSLAVRGSGRFCDLGTGNLAAVGLAHYHRPSISPRIQFNRLTGGAGRDAGGSGVLVAHR
jgi:hypothetical protein